MSGFTAASMAAGVCSACSSSLAVACCVMARWDPGGCCLHSCGCACMCPALACCTIASWDFGGCCLLYCGCTCMCPVLACCTMASWDSGGCCLLSCGRAACARCLLAARWRVGIPVAAACFPAVAPACSRLGILVAAAWCPDAGSWSLRSPWLRGPFSVDCWVAMPGCWLLGCSISIAVGASAACNMEPGDSVGCVPGRCS